MIYSKWTGKQGEFLFLGKTHLLFITAIKMFLIWDTCPLVFRFPFQWRILAETKVWNLPTWPLFWHFKKAFDLCLFFSFESIVITERIFSLVFSPPQTIGWLQARLLFPWGVFAVYIQTKAAFKGKSPGMFQADLVQIKMPFCPPLKFRKWEGKFGKTSPTTIILHKATAFISKTGEEFLPQWI